QTACGGPVGAFSYAYRSRVQYSPVHSNENLSDELTQSNRAEKSPFPIILTATFVHMDDIDTPEAMAWAELQRRGSIRSRSLQDLRDEISGELARCLDPVVHEHDIRPYGAIVCRDLPHLDHLGRLLSTD